LLQERWRTSGIIGRDVGLRPEASWRDAVTEHFWATIRVYEEIRDDFAELAKLPSDDILRRRRPSDRAGGSPTDAAAAGRG
jgi:hypothetical protein